MGVGFIIQNSGPRDLFQPIQASGGTIQDIEIAGVEYRLHIFSSIGSSSFSVTDIGTDGEVDVLVVAGGGSGGVDNGAGAGGGGVIDTVFTVSPQTYTFSVGLGAAKG